MKAAEIQKALTEQLVGKSWRSYEWYCSVFNVVRNLLPDILGNPCDHATYDYHGQAVDIKYKGHCLIRVEAKKEKGKRHYGIFGGSYCDWSFKSFGVYVYDYSGKGDMDVDTNVAIGEILKLVEAEKLAADAEFVKTVKACKILMKEFGIDIYGAKNLAKAITENYWKSGFAEAVKGE